LLSVTFVLQSFCPSKSKNLPTALTFDPQPTGGIYGDINRNSKAGLSVTIIEEGKYTKTL